MPHRDRPGAHLPRRPLSRRRHAGRAYPQGVFISRNLTSDPDTGLGRWSDAEVAAAIRDGRSKDGRALNVWAMPWAFFHNLTPDDARAIARYLKTLPAVRNEIPPPLHYGVIETIAAKFWLGDPLLGQAPRLTYDVGSYANPGGLTAGAIEAGLAWAQGAVLVGAVILFILAPRRAGTRRRWARAIGAIVAGAAILALGYFFDATPTLPILPPEQVSQGASGTIPHPDVSQASPERAALVVRGRYIFANASCALCHGNDGAGGLKVNGHDFGTIFVANLTSDRDAGLGAWSDAEIARAIRSGVSRNGRPLFWQGMPWDHFSNLDEEDVASVIAFLRTLPPIAPRRRPTTARAGRLPHLHVLDRARSGARMPVSGLLTPACAPKGRESLGVRSRCWADAPKGLAPLHCNVCPAFATATLRKKRPFPAASRTGNRPIAALRRLPEAAWTAYLEPDSGAAIAGSSVLVCATAEGPMTANRKIAAILVAEWSATAGSRAPTRIEPWLACGRCEAI